MEVFRIQSVSLCQRLPLDSSLLRPSVRHSGACMDISLHRGREGERAPHGGESSSDGRRLRKAEELAERRLPQTDDRWLQRNERGRRRLPQSSEAMGQKTQRGLDFRALWHDKVTSSHIISECHCYEKVQSRNNNNKNILA